MAENELRAWCEWSEKCDIELCSQEAAAILNKTGDKALKAGVKKLPVSIKQTIDASSNRMSGYGFALLQTHALGHVYTKKVKKQELVGKSYKSGMFFRAKNSADQVKTLKNSAYAMIRTAVREAWIREAPESQWISLQATHSSKENDKDNRTLEDLLPDDKYCEDYAIKELLEIAKKETPAVFEAMPFIHRVILLAKALDIPYSNSPVIRDVTDKSASSLGDQFRYIFKRCDYLTILEQKFPGEDPDTMKLLYQMVLGMCEQLAIEWGRSEKQCEPIFNSIET